MTQLRVLQVVSRLGMGGAETWLMELLRRWNSPEAPVRTDFLLTSGGQGHFDEEARALGAGLHYVPFTRATLPRFFREFARILKAGRYDALHDHADLSSGWRLAFPSSSMPRVRITHVHNPVFQLAENYGTGPLRRFNIRAGRYLVRRRASLVLGTSRQLLEEYGFFGAPFQRVPKRVIHCGFALERFGGSPARAAQSVREEMGWPEATPIVLFAGRLDASLDLDHPQNHKNSALALEIFRAAHALDPALRLIMAGANAYVRSAFESRVEALGLEGAVRLLGVRRDIERLQLGASALLFPSRAEGLGMVAVEAQAAGLPVLKSSAVPAEAVVIPELVRSLPLTAPIAAWARELVELTSAARPEPTVADARWQSSAFNIEVSAKLLECAYRGV
jgi:glycosyltransferase involved in cell wall biosynthesis